MKKTILSLAIVGMSTGVHAGLTTPDVGTPVQPINDTIEKCIVSLGAGMVGREEKSGSTTCDFYHGESDNGGYDVEIEATKSDTGNLKLSYATSNEKDEFTNATVVKHEKANIVHLEAKRVDNSQNGEFDVALINTKSGKQIARVITIDENGSERITHVVEGENGSLKVDKDVDGNRLVEIVDKNGQAFIPAPKQPSVPTNPRAPHMPIEEDDMIIVEPIDGGNPNHGVIDADEIRDTVQKIKELESDRVAQVEAINQSLANTGYRVEISGLPSSNDVTGTGIIIYKPDGTTETVSTDDVDKKMDELRDEQEQRADERSNPTPVVPIGDVIGGEAAKAVVAYRAQEAVAQNTIEDRVGSLETEMADMEYFFNKEIDRLDEKMDGVMASTQAVNAARPYLFNGQTSAVGVGIGAAGSEQAVAVGYAHRINENWSANANVSATSGNDTEVSAGAGVSFAW